MKTHHLGVHCNIQEDDVPFTVSLLLLYYETVIENVLWMKDPLWQHPYLPLLLLLWPNIIWENFPKFKQVPAVLVSPFSCTNRSNVNTGAAHTPQVSFRHENRLNFSYLTLLGSILKAREKKIKKCSTLSLLPHFFLSLRHFHHLRYISKSLFNLWKMSLSNAVPNRQTEKKDNYY